MSIPKWWGDWRPGLTPHTGNLQSTDLIECTQIVGGQPVNTAITGQQIINAASGGGGGVTLVTQKNNITTAATSAMQILASEDISSSIGLGMLQVTAMFRKTVGTQAWTPRLYVNSSASLTGATLIATFGTVSALNNISDNIVSFSISASNNLYATNVSGGLFLRYAQGAGTIVALPSPCYLIWAGQLTNAADQVVLINSNVVKYA